MNAGCESQHGESSGAARRRSELVAFAFGETGSHEFSAAREYLATHTRLIEVENSEAAPQRAGEIVPDVLVWFVPRPGEFPFVEFQRATARWPLARPVVVLGSWCEGELRTGRPWPGAWRVAWDQAEAQFARHFAALATGAADAWSLPRTASRSEILAEESASLVPEIQTRRNWRLAVVAATREAAEAYEFACRAAGHTVVNAASAEAVIWDSAAWGEADLEALRQTVAAASPAKVVAVIGGLRWQDAAEAKSAGSVAVLAKPLVLADLWATIESAVPRLDKS